MSTNEKTEQSLHRLSDITTQATSILKVISEISSKTDLLALNASIEAARAGSYGKGFAIVAHEVSRLSEKTQESISEIEEIITSIKDEVGTLTDTLN
ncbi:MAG: hypothetical protein KAG61_01655 [Bacteriovoracaceae bacterium]|nr:hypothetical protein [Bacteriovoracaceae bacterium]